MKWYCGFISGGFCVSALGILTSHRKGLGARVDTLWSWRDALEGCTVLPLATLLACLL